MITDMHGNINEQRYYDENLCLITKGDKYIHIDWLMEDFSPEEPWYDTEFGPCPKQYAVIDGTVYLKADCSIISKS